MELNTQQIRQDFETGRWRPSTIRQLLDEIDRLRAEQSGLSPEANFANAFRYALTQGHIKFGLENYEGWQEGCDCARCRSQRIIVDFLSSKQLRSEAPRAYDVGLPGPGQDEKEYDILGLA